VLGERGGGSGSGSGGGANPPPACIRMSEVVVGRDGLQLAFRARERLVVGTNPLQHSRFEWEGVSWQENPPTRVSSEGGIVLGVWVFTTHVRRRHI
jgi:hypothetical protein